MLLVWSRKEIWLVPAAVLNRGLRVLEHSSHEEMNPWTLALLGTALSNRVYAMRPLRLGQQRPCGFLPVLGPLALGKGRHM